MEHQPSTLARNIPVKQRDTINIQDDIINQDLRKNTRTAIVDTHSNVPRIHFRRSTLFTALATSLVGFGIAPAALADTVNTPNIPNQSVNNSVVTDQSDMLLEDDTQLDKALDALRLKKAVEQGIIDQSVLDDYTEQTLGMKKSGSERSDSKNNSTQNSATQPRNTASSQANGNDEFTVMDDINSAQLNLADNANDDLLQKAAAIQQQGYQMMTPEQIDRELAAMDLQNTQDIDGINNNNNNNNVNDSGFDNSFANNISSNDSDFDGPIATLNDTTPPIGLDLALDSNTLPLPGNLDTLGRTEVENETATEAAGVMPRPINVSDSVSSGRVDGADDNFATSGSVATSDSVATNANAETNAEDTPSEIINPDDYLPDYQAATQTADESIEQTNKPKPSARSKGSIVKRLYNRLFNSGSMSLPHVETTIYLQQADSENIANSQPKIIEADDDIQPMKNIKAALDDTTVQSVVDFTAALPRLRETALNAAKAVGYYETSLRLRQPSPDTIEVVIEELGEPVIVDSRIIEIRGEGSEQEEFATFEKELPPQEGDVFNHRVYQSSKAALESLSNTYGYFDQYWLNKSVDIILPDNTADVSLIYNTGDRYEFDDVVFFTYDAETNTLTQDPDKLPVELPLLRQLFDFKKGDPFYRPDVTKFSNDLSATRYFNTVNVESILPPNDRSEASTLAFDNSPTNNNGTLDGDINNDGASDVVNDNKGIVAASNDPRNISQDNAANNNAAADTGEENNLGANNLDASNPETNTGETVNAADIAAIDFSADEETLDKLQAIRQKADRLSRLPDNRVLDEKDQEASNLLGKISDSISNVAQKIFPDEKSILADENFVPPTLAGRKTPQEVAENKKVPLYVFVSSSKPRDAEVGLGYGTDTGVRATAKIDYNLLNRKGYQAGAETEVSRISKNVAVYASRPWKHPLNDKLDARLTYEEEVIDQGKGNFDLSTKTLKAALARNIRSDKGWNRSYSLRYRLDELETGVDDTKIDDLPIRFTSSSPKQQALLLGYGINKTSVDNATNPTRGIRQYYSIEAGADKAFSDTNLAIARAGVSGIYSFGDDKKHQVLGSVNTGYIWADDFYEVPYKLRFFAGGDQSIRGYDYESLSPLDKGYLTGGQILAVGSAEYNYEFKPGFRGAFFTDVGNAYDKNFDTETKVGVGVGIRWASPVGVVRVDVAAGVTEDSIPIRLHFFIGSPL